MPIVLSGRIGRSNEVSEGAAGIVCEFLEECLSLGICEGPHDGKKFVVVRYTAVYGFAHNFQSRTARFRRKSLCQGEILANIF